MKTLTQLADKFEKLLDRLPGAIRTPVEREWRPIKELFIQRRAPRILVIGSGATAFVQSLTETSGVHPIDPTSGVAHPEIATSESGLWHSFRHRGELEYIVADGSGAAAKNAILSAPPDLFVFLTGENLTPRDITLLQELHRFDRERYREPGPIVAAGMQLVELTDALDRDETLRPSVAAILPGGHREGILAAIAQALPQEAQLEFARLSGEKGVQREIALKLSRSITAVCAAIGAQPIPLADFPVLTGLQVLLVAGIVHVAGREWSLKTVRDFLGALGVNVGVGLVFREGARAAVKFLPGWGNAISGAVAGGGTYAIGRAATAYFIDGLPIEEARNKFKLPKWKWPTRKEKVSKGETILELPHSHDE